MVYRNFFFFFFEKKKNRNHFTLVKRCYSCQPKMISVCLRFSVIPNTGKWVKRLCQNNGALVASI
jgi:hypothetical protein